MRNTEHDRQTGALVRDVLAEHGVPGYKAADAIGVTPARMSERLHGTTRFTAYDIAALCDLLGTSPGQLIPPVPGGPRWYDDDTEADR